MSINPNLMYALLSMDAYNRGPNSALTVNAFNGAGANRGVGSATFAVESAPALHTSSSFYAVTFEWNGNKVI